MDAIDSGAFRRRFEKLASQAVRTHLRAPRDSKNAHVAPVEKVYLQHCRATSVTGQIVANRLAPLDRLAGPESRDFEIRGRPRRCIPDPAATSSSTWLPSSRSRGTGEATKISLAGRLPMRSGKHDATDREFVIYVTSWWGWTAVPRWEENYGGVSLSLKGENIATQHSPFFPLSVDRSSARRTIRVGQFSFHVA